MRDYFVVTDNKGNFVGIDTASGGYPYVSSHPYIDFRDEGHAKSYADEINNPRRHDSNYIEFRVMKLAFVEINHD